MRNICGAKVSKIFEVEKLFPKKVPIFLKTNGLQMGNHPNFDAPPITLAVPRQKWVVPLTFVFREDLAFPDFLCHLVWQQFFVVLLCHIPMQSW